MRTLTIDYSFRNREESEEFWGVGAPRWIRIVLAMFGIVTIPFELAAELLVVFLGFVARIGSVLLWMTNPIEKKQTKTNAEEES